MEELRSLPALHNGDAFHQMVEANFALKSAIENRNLE